MHIPCFCPPKMFHLLFATSHLLFTTCRLEATTSRLCIATNPLCFTTCRLLIPGFCFLVASCCLCFTTMSGCTAYFNWFQEFFIGRSGPTIPAYPCLLISTNSLCFSMMISFSWRVIRPSFSKLLSSFTALSVEMPANSAMSFRERSWNISLFSSLRLSM